MYPSAFMLDMLRVALLPPPEPQYEEAGGSSEAYDDEYQVDGQYGAEYHADSYSGFTDGAADVGTGAHSRYAWPHGCRC